MNVTFAPTNPGQRIGAVQLMGASGSPLATFNLHGIGTGPQVVFNAPLTPTVLGGGFSQPWGVAVDGNGNIYVADEDNGEVKEMTPGCLSASCVTILGGPFPSPEGVAVDGGGSVYVADPSAGVVSKIPAGCTSASCVTTLGGGFMFPHGLALDASGNVYVPDQGKHAVYEIPAGCTSASCVITLGGGFNFPYGVALDASGNVYVADAGNSAVLEIPAGCESAGCVTTLGGGLSGPTGVAVDASGNVYVADTDNNAVREVPAGCTSSNCVITLESGFKTPQGVALDGSGNIYVGDRHNNAVKELVRSTPPSLTFASSNVGVASSDSPQSVVIQNSGNAALTTVSPGLSLSTNFIQVAGSGTPADCSATFSLTPSQQCNLSLSFIPTTTGPLTGSAQLTNNALNQSPATQSISLSGTGVALPSTLAVTVTPIGSFTQGQTAEWDVQVYNLAALATDATSGTTTLVDTLPTGYTLSSFVGTGWNCNAVTTTITCTSSQVVAGASGSFNKLRFIVNVPAASALSVTDHVSVYGGGDPNHASLATAATALSTVSVAQAPASITMSSGNNQTVAVNSAFPVNLSVVVKDASSNGIAGATVTFTAPLTGPSGTFSNGTNTLTTVTNASGIAAASQFTANANGGGPYSVTAAAGSLSTPFSLTNTFLTQSIQNFGTISTQVVGTPLTLIATATSGLAVSYGSNTQTVCTVSSGTVTFLTPGQCSITASQAGNNSYTAATSITQQFTVNPNTPTISNLQAVSVGGNSELITWKTDQPSTSQVTYGATITPLDSNLVTFHSVTLTGLAQNTAYTYQVSSTNSTNGTVTSPNGTFTTTPFVGYVAFWGGNNSGITISWSTDFAATTFVAYGTTTALGQTSPVQSALSNGHGVVLTGLNPGTTYYFRAESTDGNGHTGASTLYNFTTTGQPASPAPVITNVTVTNITTTGATITWTTDQAATTQVNYGTTTSYGSSSLLNSSLVNSHSVTLSGLTPGTTYDYDVISTNSSGTSSGMSTNYTFTTTAIIGTPPVISNIQTAVTSTTATITWTTDQAANSAISGTVSKSPDSNYVTSHSVTLTGLTAGTLYSFAVVSTNAGGLTTTSPTSSFTTTAANATAPFVGYVAFWGVNNSGVTISWSTDLAANTQLNYGTTPSLGTLTPVQGGLTNSHGVVLTGLASGTTYYFVAQSTGANGATGYSTTYSFTTTGSPSAPAPNISNIQTSVTTTSATITWTTDEAASSQVNYGVTTTYSSSSTLNTNLSTTHSVTLTGLMPGTTYDFDVMSANINGTSSISSNSTFQTTGTAPGPVIGSVAASSITSSTALITWTTDQASTSVVNYGQTVSSATLVTSHSVTLSGLTPNTQYSFSVTSVNAASVSTTSSSYTFTTSAASAAGPVISYVAYWGITSSGITISWSTNVPSNTSVAYGTTNALTSVTPVQTALSNSHGVTLTGLKPGTLYYFQAQSADVNGNTGYSTVYSFTTLAGGTPIISNVLVTPGSGNTASISWTTSAPTYSYVQYGPSSGNYNRYSPQSSLTASPNVSLGFVPSGTVYYQLVSTDANGDQVVSPEAMFVEP